MRKQRWLGASAALVSLMLVLAACNNGGGESTAESAAESAGSVAPSVAPVDFKACEVSDTGGIDDKGFNQNAYEGLQRAETELGIEIAFLESSADTDYAPNIQTFLGDCDLIVTVGFLLGDATKTAAEANPNQLFAIVDFAYDPAVPNIRGLVFDTESASMLQGYLAAGMSTTGVVGTFGGAKIGPVTDFMDGFVAGVNYYNEQNDATVVVKGWDPATQEGVFTDNFDDLALGRQKAEALMQEDADIIFAVAGPAGQGAMAAVQDNPSALDPKPLIIGVDVDQYLSVPGFEDIMLSSELKRMDNAVFQAVKDAILGPWTENLYVGTLANDGVGIAPYHDLDSAVPAELKAGVDALKAALIDGSVKSSDYSGAPAS